WRRWPGGRCRRSPRSSPERNACSSWKIWWITAMSGRSSGAPRRSVPGAWSCRPGAPTRCTGGLAQWRAAGFQLLALTPDQSAVPLDDVHLAERVALLLGSEGDRLSSRWLHEADQAVCIPMSPAAMALGVDSLNVVAAAAVACHGLMRGVPGAVTRPGYGRGSGTRRAAAA